MLKLTYEWYLLVKVLYNNELFGVVNDESFVFKILLFLTCETMIFAIYLIKFQHHHLDLDALVF